MVHSREKINIAERLFNVVKGVKSVSHDHTVHEHVCTKWLSGVGMKEKRLCLCNEAVLENSVS